MPESGNIGAVLTGATALLRGETPSPALDAELLLAHLLKQPREFVLAHRSDPLPASRARAFTGLVRRRVEGVPLAYLFGQWGFYNRTFTVTPAVMVPRPESEAIVDEAVRLCDTTRPLHPIVTDIGTGSGVLAVSIAAEAERVRVVAADRSPAALAVARRNARRHKVLRRITLTESDLLNEFPPELAPHLIVANLPYLPSDELQRAGDPPSSRRELRSCTGLRGAGHLETRGLTWEPKTALDGGPDGLFVIRRLLAQLAKLRTRNSELSASVQHLILEHSPSQRRRLLVLAHDALPDFTPHAVTPFVTSWTRR